MSLEDLLKSSCKGLQTPYQTHRVTRCPRAMSYSDLCQSTQRHLLTDKELSALSCAVFIEAAASKMKKNALS